MKQDSNLFSIYNQIHLKDVWLYRLDHNGIPTNKDKWIDIKYITEEIDIYEDIFSPCISAQILLTDILNLPDSYPIVGGERIKIIFETPSLTDIELDLVIYKTGDKLKDLENAHDKGQLLWLYLCTPDKYTDINYNISIALTGTYSDITKQSLTLLKTTKKLYSDPSIGSFNYIIPYCSILDNIKTCTTRAFDFNNSCFFFYENLKGYNFKSLYNLFNQQPYKNLYIEPRTTHYNIENSDKSLNTLTDIEYKKSNNKLIQHSEGVFGVDEIYSLNINNKKLSKTKFEYSNDKVRLNKYPLYDDSVGIKNQVRVQLEKFDNSHLNLPFRNVTKYTLNNFSIIAEVIGDSSLYTGCLINLNIPSTTSINQYQEEQLTSGKWLVSSIRHIITKSRYRQNIELVSDSYNVDVNKIINGQ